MSCPVKEGAGRRRGGRLSRCVARTPSGHHLYSQLARGRKSGLLRCGPLSFRARAQILSVRVLPPLPGTRPEHRLSACPLGAPTERASGSDVARRAAAPSGRDDATDRAPATAAASRGLGAEPTACTGAELPAAAAAHAATASATAAVTTAAAIGPASAAAHLGLLARCIRGASAVGGSGVRRLVAAARARVAGAAARLVVRA